jgi:CheY-like chemotaxis protein
MLIDGTRTPASVLVVVHDDPTRTAMASGLAAAGYAVVTARNGAEGVHLARRDRPALVLLELELPVMDGWQVLQYLRAYRETRSLLVCIVSGAPLDDMQRKRLAAGRVWLAVPRSISAEHLVEQVASCLASPPPSHS